MDYRQVGEALKAGADPALLCSTCPWDRYCMTPPAMTSGEIEQRMREAEAKDEQMIKNAELTGQKPTMPVTTLLTAVTLGGRDTSASVCPVFALRFRTSSGRRIAEELKAQMRNWDDSRV